MIITGPYQGWHKNLGFLQEIFTIFIGYLGFNSGHKITTHMWTPQIAIYIWVSFVLN